jgi:Family of unknown function (DUF6152)
MVSIPRATLFVVALLAALPLLVEAHHGQAMFDDKEITLQGVVKEFQYSNPHSWLLVDVTNKDGSVTTWGFEAEGPSTMLQKGIHKSDLSPGTKVTITGKPMKNKQPAAMWMTLVREDGVVFDPRRPATPPPPPAK